MSKDEFIIKDARQFYANLFWFVLATSVLMMYAIPNILCNGLDIARSVIFLSMFLIIILYLYMKYKYYNVRFGKNYIKLGSSALKPNEIYAIYRSLYAYKDINSKKRYKKR